jgi:hypothetical protein
VLRVRYKQNNFRLQPKRKSETNWLKESGKTFGYTAGRMRVEWVMVMMMIDILCYKIVFASSPAPLPA